MFPVPPVIGTVAVNGVTVNVQFDAPEACVTVNVCPPIVMLPVRSLPVFASALYATVTLPLPDAALVTCSHDESVAVVHWHVVAEAVMLNDPVPPAAGTLPLVGLIE